MGGQVWLDGAHGGHVEEWHGGAQCLTTRPTPGAPWRPPAIMCQLIATLFTDTNTWKKLASPSEAGNAVKSRCKLPEP